MPKDFTTYNHGTAPIDMSFLSIVGNLHQMRPHQLHLKEDGAVGDKPSFALVFIDGNRNIVVGEISEEMLSEGFKELGYSLEKVK